MKLNRSHVFRIVLSIFTLAAISSCFHCSSSQDKMVYDGFERARSVAVLNGVVPDEMPRTPALYYKLNGIHQQFPEEFEAVKESVKAGIDDSGWQLEKVFFPESRSQFEAELVAGLYLRGYYERVEGVRFRLVLESWLSFKNDRMNKFFGNPRGYLAARITSPDRAVPEHDEYVDKNMERKAFEYLMRFLPANTYLPQLKSETQAGTTRIIQEIQKKYQK